MGDALVLFGVAAIILASCGGAALLRWIEWKRTAEERQLAHAERLKALELGQPLPDAEVTRLKTENEALLARINTAGKRTDLAGAIAIVVPLIMAVAAVGGSALVLPLAAAALHLPLLCIIWGVCGLVALVSVTISLGILRQRSQPPNGGDAQKGAYRPAADESVAAIQERPLSP